MSAHTISQRDAHRLRRRVKQLENLIAAERRTYGQEWEGVNICTATWEPAARVPVSIRTATRLGHKVVVIANDAGLVKFMALPHAKETPQRGMQ